MPPIRFEVVLANAADRMMADAGYHPAGEVCRVSTPAEVRDRTAYVALPPAVASALGLIDGGYVDLTAYGRQTPCRVVVDPAAVVPGVGSHLLPVLDLVIDIDAGTVKPRFPDYTEYVMGWAGSVIEDDQ